MYTRSGVQFHTWFSRCGDLHCEVESELLRRCGRVGAVGGGPTSGEASGISTLVRELRLKNSDVVGDQTPETTSSDVCKRVASPDDFSAGPHSHAFLSGRPGFPVNDSSGDAVPDVCTDSDRPVLVADETTM